MVMKVNARHVAHEFLDRSGYTVIDTDWSEGIVVWERKTDTMVFCIVRENAKRPPKITEGIYRKANAWRHENKWRGAYRVDFVNVYSYGSNYAIDHIENVKYKKGN